MLIGAARMADEVTRLKREDHERTKHDSQFSKWKVLIGPDDWEDHSVGKEGVARYRVENLPRSSGPGVYELAIYRTGSSSRDNLGRLDSNKGFVVYLGQADNVKTRLQQYGRTGAHLGRNDSGFFEDIFARGYSIAYRWASMENKADAQRTEDQLLKKFDYAWNKGSNGARRHDDIFQKLDKHASNPTKLGNFSKKHLPILQKQVGIKIKAIKLLSQDNEFSKYADGESYNFLTQVFKFSRSQPRLVLDRGGSNENDTCGVVLGYGSICRRPPTEGRKRCAEHKGKKTKGSSLTLPRLVLDGGGSNENDTITCGVVLEDGSICRRPAAEGRKRCAEHKGKKTEGSSVSLSTSEKSQLHKPCSEASGFDKKSSAIFLPGVSPRRPVFSEGCDTICGVEFGNGYFCTKQPVGRTFRCEDHKGMKVTSLLSGLDAKSKSHVFDTDSRFDSRNWNHGSNSSSTSICGATTCNGSVCQRPVTGNARCWQHLNSGSSCSSSSSICGAPTCNGASCQRTVQGNGRCWQHLNYGGSNSSGNFSPQYSNYGYGGSSTSICGAPTRNGSSCRRTVKGNGRCWQH